MYPAHTIKITPCHHYYHLGCLDAWAMTMPPNSSHITICPSCRYEIELFPFAKGNEPIDTIGTRNERSNRCLYIIITVIVLVTGIIGTIIYLAIFL